jgi:fructose-1,6-bisphosphatase/inositol monophosphatase family enzyme
MAQSPLIPRAASGAEAIEVAWRCVREGGAIALSRFRGERHIDVKGRGNVVTDADLAVEAAVKAILGAEFPSCKILSEETASATDASSDWTWVLDPIDGTKNYSMGIPFWCVNIALCRNGQPVLGITYDAVHDESFWAVEGGGAYCGEQRLNASDQPDVESSVVGVDLGYDDAMGVSQIALISRIFPHVQSIRILGSAALGIAYAAAGRIDLFTHSNLSAWDVAAGMLLLREAEGAATDRYGAPLELTSGTVAVGGRRVHADFMARYARRQGAGS